MKIIITGAKSSGKSTAGKQVAEIMGLPFYDIDALIEDLYKQQSGKALPFYEICKTIGEEQFRKYEELAVEKASQYDWCVLSTGGSTFLKAKSRNTLRGNSIIVFLKSEAPLLWDRLLNAGKSKYLEGDNAKERFEKHINFVNEVIEPFADVVLDAGEALAETIVAQISELMAILSKSANTFGEVVRITTFGESHGKGLGAVIDGIKPGLELSTEDIQPWLDRRRPGQSKVVSPRNELDRVEILSGVFEGKTTGTPIALLIRNADQDSSKYEEIRQLFRPGHADFTFFKKYGIRDHRGGGRSSGRETAARVAGGAVANKILLEKGIKITAYSLEIAAIRAKSFDYSEIDNNPVRCPDVSAAAEMEQAILDARKQGDSVGGIVEIVIEGVAAGLGDPVFGKLDGRLAAALCSLGAVKGIEFGDGFAAAKAKASEFNDQMGENGKFLTNHCGGILGGISTGQKIIIRLAVKPTPSITSKQNTCDLEGLPKQISIGGRHDPCIVPRIIPVVEAMTALVILDALEIQKRIKN